MRSVAFKNIFIYRLSREVSWDTAEVNAALSKFVFTPCGSQDMAKAGWTSVLGDNLTHEYQGFLLIQHKREEKILPSQVLKEELQKKILTLEEEQDRKLKKTEKDSLKDEVLHSLLPRAFTRKSLAKILIDRRNHLVFVEASSAKKAEDQLALLRKSLGSLPVIPFTPREPLEITMTEWFKNGFPAGFTAGEDATLKGLLDNGGAVRCNKVDLQSDEIMSHIEAGKVATTVAINWMDRASFRVNDDMSIKALTFCDDLYDQNDDIDREDVAQRFDADFVLFTGELSALFNALVEAIGGEAER
ncbi:recombination-associated protein RdgC [Salmonella enterica subsp. enterica serovar 4,[5],12:i:-]|uniref:Recombination-associated protein RdgC n=11 Tax=Enterobacteriaceae TaxID=543 RepID=A0A2S8JYV2_ECOLX|nr:MULTISPECIES: recombination-associated protein RdgC [Enterobacteriaceae]YP_009914742.1 exonuclease recombination-associated [Escherichia phage D6]EAP1684182.1 recombination-associated protein RdgC [Salmonella enterica subsp. enterica serovar Johannesburg]EBH3297781.1 recombination-associated protein RdgC [Salmonella enterica subsp. enterica serovar Javiana]EBY3128423.1 recombination-associated protein RdgC [Salmonella enterica subsp. enterica serovar Mikawasima]ECI5641651.1 recombination-as